MAVKIKPSECYASFKATGTVCGGCQQQHNCAMGKDTRDYLLKVFLPKVNSSKQIKLTAL